MLAGAKSVCGIADWSKSIDRRTLRRLGIKPRKPPSESAIRKFLIKLDAHSIDGLIGPWLLGQANTDSLEIAIDGKALRGSRKGGKCCFLLSALLHEQGLTIAQTKVDEKSNEIKAVKPLLEDLDITGAVVTLDAMHTQTETARYIVSEKRADYLMTVKDNQRGLREAIGDAGMMTFSPSADIRRQRPRSHRNSYYKGLEQRQRN
jgi:hypothetical protein